jgi:acyl-coenzyme A synthetase/AMP-(fatty) acid ligase
MLNIKQKQIFFNHFMKRAVLCVPNPEHYIDQLDDYSIMIVNPKNTPARLNYLLDRSDYSLLVTEQGEQYRSGGDYKNERVLWYTSGTTGDSKFCSFSQEQLDRASDNIIREYSLDVNDRYVSVMGLWHSHGQGLYWATKRAGCETHFLEPTNLRAMSNLAPTFISAIPDILKTVYRFEFEHLRFIRSASAAMPDNLYKQLKSKFHVPVIEAFGMTEALSHCFTNPLYGEQRLGRVGLPSGIQARIIDGQLWIQGDSVFTHEWYNTGDLAEQDEQGYYRILGRSVDQINVKGYKLNPVSIEQQLSRSLPDIIECAVFGRDQVKCLYQGAVDPKQVLDVLISLAPQCRPKILLQVDAIPKNSIGKVSRSMLDTMY